MSSLRRVQGRAFKNRQREINNFLQRRGCTRKRLVFYSRDQAVDYVIAKLRTANWFNLYGSLRQPDPVIWQLVAYRCGDNHVHLGHPKYEEEGKLEAFHEEVMQRFGLIIWFEIKKELDALKRSWVVDGGQKIAYEAS